MMNRLKTKRNAEIEVFNTEYVPDLEWTVVEPTTKARYDADDGEKMVESQFRSRNNVSSSGRIPDLGQPHNSVVDDFQSILHLIKLIKKMIKYNSIYYEKIEKRRQRQNIELQGLTVLLQNICNDLKNV